MFTDGLAEARSEDNRSYGERRLLNAFVESVKQTPIHAATEVADQIDQYRKTVPQEDDYTLVIFDILNPNATRVPIREIEEAC